MNDINCLFFLDPTPQSLINLPGTVRRRLYGRHGEIFYDHAIPGKKAPTKNKAGEPRRVIISVVDKNRARPLSVAFANLHQRLVILDLGPSASMAEKELQLKLDALAHLDFSNLGLIVRELALGSAAGAKILDKALDLYCRTYARTETSRSRLQWRRMTDASVRHWSSSEARQNFKDVLDQAERDPQVIERGDRRFVVVEESRIPALMNRKNAEEMYRHFFEDTEPVEPFERIRGQAPGRLLDLN